MAIIPKKTGAAMTMTWLGDIWRRLSRPSGQRASGVNPDDFPDHAFAQAAGHTDHEVVQVDGGVAMPRHQPEHPADLRHPRAGPGRAQDAVFVAAVGVVEFRLRA